MKYIPPIGSSREIRSADEWRRALEDIPRQRAEMIAVLNDTLAVLAPQGDDPAAMRMYDRVRAALMRAGALSDGYPRPVKRQAA